MSVPLRHREELEFVSFDPQGFMVYLPRRGTEACPPCISRLLFLQITALPFFFHPSLHSKLVRIHLTVNPHPLFSFFNTSIGTATEIADLPGFYVRIIPSASSLFDVSKLNFSTRNNVRAYTKGNMRTLEALTPITLAFNVGFFLRLTDQICIADGINQPTPKYNNSLLEDMFLEENAESISCTFANWKALQEALVLLKV
jgi:hypothetical protein